MYTALYYPHINITSQSLIKTALLLWDRLEYIAPDRSFRSYAKERDTMEALELISAPHFLSNEEKSIVHDQIMGLVNSGIPDWFFFRPQSTYQIYSEKLLPITWDMLQENNLAIPNSIENGFNLNNLLGLYLMSLIAECCAGSQKRTVTDEIDAYAALTRSITALYEGEYGVASQEYERLTSISLKVINAEELELKRLVEIRKREIINGDTFLTGFRHKYLDAIDRCVERITQEARHDGDKEEIVRLFEQEMQGDLGELKRELKLGAADVLLSKEVFVAGLAAIGTLVEPISGSIISCGALLRTIVKHRGARQKVMKDHAMSWLYLAKHRHPIF